MDKIYHTTPALDQASLLLDRLHANLDAIYTLACLDGIENLNEGTLASVLDGAIDTCAQARQLIDGR
ncbi:MAG TPA: hypothetical protein VHK70_07810 [Burkholderiaceae bacterium]|jgi:hypothetical protein|nr:hypothetical protein [Burkholderiaceae bacterium]